MIPAAGGALTEQMEPGGRRADPGLRSTGFSPRRHEPGNVTTDDVLPMSVAPLTGQH